MARHLSPTPWLLQKLFLCPVLSWHCLLHQPHPSPAASPAGLSSPRSPVSPPGQVHVENYCASHTSRKSHLCWNHLSSVSSWSCLYVSEHVTQCAHNHLLDHPASHTHCIPYFVLKHMDKLSRLRESPEDSLFICVLKARKG